MQCFICVTYMIILCTAQPGKDRKVPSGLEKRSLFRDVIESLRIRSQLPEDLNQNDENNLSHNYDRYGFESDQSRLPSDVDYVPRRNDRIEMPSLKYRFPKNIKINDSNDDVTENVKKEVVVYISTKAPKTTTQKPKKVLRPKPIINKHKNGIKTKDDEEYEVKEVEDILSYNMYGHRKTGDRESQMIIKPTVIVHYQGTLNNEDNDIKKNKTREVTDPYENYITINQNISLTGTIGNLGNLDINEEPNEVIHRIKTKQKLDKDKHGGITCEKAVLNPEKNEIKGRKFRNVLQILF